MNKYVATFRHKVTKKELQEPTTAFNAQDAVFQCIVGFAGKGHQSADYDMVALGPHPDEMHSVSSELRHVFDRMKS